MLTQRCILIHCFPLSLMIYFRTSHWRIFSHEKANIDRSCLRSAVCHLALVYLPVHDLVSHDRNPIIITRVRVKDETVAAYTVTDRLAGSSVLLPRRYPRTSFPQEAKEPDRREKLRHALFTGSKVPAPISSCRLPLLPPIPYHRRYRPLLRSRASTWAKRIKKIHRERERERSPRSSGEVSQRILSARAKGVEE